MDFMLLSVKTAFVPYSNVNREHKLRRFRWPVITTKGETDRQKIEQTNVWYRWTYKSFLMGMYEIFQPMDRFNVPMSFGGVHETLSAYKLGRRKNWTSA